MAARSTTFIPHLPEQLLALIASLNGRKPECVSFARLASRWQEQVACHSKPSSQKIAASHLRRRLLPRFGACNVADITPEAVQVFFNTAAEKLSPTSLASLLGTFGGIMKTAVRWGYCLANPAAGVVLPRAESTPRLCYTVEQVRAILAAATGDLWLELYLLAETGLRSGELAGLHVDDIDVKNRTLTVRRTRYPNGLEDRPKTRASNRRLYLSERLANCLAGHVGTRQSGLLFTPCRLRRKLRPIFKRLGITGTVHGLRHFNASLMDSLGVPFAIRQLRLGHTAATVLPGANAITLGTYTHAFAEDEKQAAEKIALAWGR